MTELIALPLELLGVPVLVSCEAAAADRVELCYARSLSSGRAGAEGEAVCASLIRSAIGWRIRVGSLEVSVEGELIDGVRALHHELLHAVMRRASHCFYVHAGVVELGGQAVVLPGVSRAGKSTLVLAFLRAGARLLSDEILAFDPVQGVCRAFPRAVKIRDVCVPYFPEWSARFEGHGEGRFLPFDFLPDDVVAGSARVGAVVVPRWSEAPGSELTPMARGLALLELTQSALNFGTHRASSVDHLSDIVREARTYALRWNEPHEAVQRVQEALSGPPGSGQC